MARCPPRWWGSAVEDLAQRRLQGRCPPHEAVGLEHRGQDALALEQQGCRRAPHRAAASGRTPGPARRWVGAGRRRSCRRARRCGPASGAVRFTGPSTSLVEQVEDRRRPRRRRAIQLIHWRPDPKRPPTPNRNSGSILASAPPWPASTIPLRRCDDARPGRRRRCRAGLPRLGDVGEESGTRRRRLVEDVVTAIAVVADRRRREQRLRAAVETGHRVGEQRRRPRPRFERPVACTRRTSAGRRCRRRRG